MKTILAFIVTTVLMASVAFGQPAATSGTSAVSTAFFTLGAGLVVEGVDADWGVLQLGTVYTILPNGLISPPTAENEVVIEPLYWTIASEGGFGQVEVTMLLPSFFQGEETGARIPYSVTSTSGGAFLEEPAEDVPYQPFDPRVPKTIFLNADGEAFVGLGGVLSIGTGIPVEDNYIGTFILTAAYTGF